MWFWGIPLLTSLMKQYFCCQLLLVMIHTLKRYVVLVYHAHFLRHISALFVLKLIMNVTTVLLEMLFVIHVKTGHLSRACRSRLGSKCSGNLSIFWDR